MNAPNRDFFEGLKRALCRVVAHEMRGVALTLPREDVKPAGPHDYDAEQAVLSALLVGHVGADDVRPLEPRHFYGTFNQRLFKLLASTAERDPQALVDLLEMHGPVMEELLTIRDATPFVCRELLQVEVAKIFNRWLERELIQTMQRLDAELRVGAITVDGAKLRLREFFMGRTG